jgi:hypothetical protein
MQVYDIPLFLSEYFHVGPRNHSLTVLVSFSQYKRNSLAKGYEQFGRYECPAKLPTHEGNVTIFSEKELAKVMA